MPAWGTLDQARRRPGWLATLSAAVEAAIVRGLAHPPRGVSPSDWERVRAAQAEDTAATTAGLRGLGPQVAAGQMLLVLNDVLTPVAGTGAFHELRTACLVTPMGVAI